MPIPIATIDSSVSSHEVQVTPTADVKAGVGFTAPNGDYLIPSRDLTAGVLGSAYRNGRFRCRKSAKTDTFSAGATLGFAANGVVAGSDPLVVYQDSTATEQYLFAELEDVLTGESGDSITAGLLSVTDSVVGRENGDEHRVTSGVMRGAIFKVVANAWEFSENATPDIFVDSSDSAAWPVSAADATTISGKLDSGQFYTFKAVDNVGNVTAFVRVDDAGRVVWERAGSTSVVSSSTNTNPLETIVASGLGASKVLDSQDGAQRTFVISGTLSSTCDFTVTNLPDENWIIMEWPAQPTAQPTFSGAVNMDNVNPDWTDVVLVSIFAINGTQYLVSLQA